MGDILLAPETRERRLGAIASRQRSRVARGQLLSAGIDRSAIDRMATRGLLFREHLGVYAVANPAPIPLSRETSALLACGPGAVLSHRSAAALWGLATPPDTVQITVEGSGTRRRRPGIEVHRTRSLPARDVRIRERLPVTAPARTMVDFAEEAPLREVERALDEGLVVRGIIRMRDLEEVANRTPRREGGRIIERLLAERGPGAVTESEAEQRFLALIGEAGLPLPETQVPIAGFRADFFWPKHKVAFEVDGYRFHKSKSAFERDRRKDAAFKRVGVDPNRVSRDMVFKRPLLVAADVSAALTRARAA